MSQNQSSSPFNPDELNQWSKAELVQIILTQQKLSEQLKQEIEKLKLSRDLDSKTSSKPPSTDLLKKSEKAKLQEDKFSEQKKKRKPGGQPAIHVDETPWPVKGVKEWLWVFTNQLFCLFRAADTRGRAELEAQLGSEYRGVLSSDDLSVYNGYAVVAQQKCWAHLRRHFQRLIKTPGLHNRAIGQAFKDLIDEAFGHYRIWQNDRDRSGYDEWTISFKEKVALNLKQWWDKAGYEAQKLLRNLQKKAEQWWYFLHHPEIPPDNNLAERSLRLAITKRKVSGGSRSMERFQQTANLLTVVQT